MTERRICLWSGPRNVSTALMYSFRERADTTVVDEPLYGHYLNWSGVVHPGRDDVLAAQSSDAGAVVDDVIFGDYPTPHVFFKLMAHHLQGMGTDWIDRVDNVLLTREPAGMLRSLTATLSEATVAETSLPIQVELLDRDLSAGRRPIVVVADKLLSNPPGVLAALCERLGIDFDAAMLSWPPGPKPEDGVWARHWYEGVHRSTGFGPPRPQQTVLDERYQPLLAECLPLFERLATFALGA